MIYTYTCGKHEKELLRKVEERDEPVKCEECGEPMKRKVERAGLVFKGKGFYSTDYK